MKKYAYLGPSGTFTEAALIKAFKGQPAERTPAKDAAEALALVESGVVDGAMLPIENSVEGGVSATLDAIARSRALHIVAEVVIPVSFVVAARSDVSLDRVTVIYTHPHSWAQTRGWVSQNMPDAEYSPATSTAAAAVLVKDSANEHSSNEQLAEARAAICSELVAEQLGLKVLAAGVEDNQGAVTRFVLVARPGELPAPTGSDKTTVAVPLPQDRPGALMDILDQFATRGVNLSRIESRPTGEHLGHYFFSIDAEGHIADERMADALRALHRLSPHLRFMGSYPRAEERHPEVAAEFSDEAFSAASAWLSEIKAGGAL